MHSLQICLVALNLSIHNFFAGYFLTVTFHHDSFYWHIIFTEGMIILTMKSGEEEGVCNTCSFYAEGEFFSCRDFFVAVIMGYVPCPISSKPVHLGML